MRVPLPSADLYSSRCLMREQGLNSSLLRDDLCACDIPPTSESLYQGYGSQLEHAFAPPTLLHVAFFLSLAVEELFC